MQVFYRLTIVFFILDSMLQYQPRLCTMENRRNALHWKKRKYELVSRPLWIFLDALFLLFDQQVIDIFII